VESQGGGELYSPAGIKEDGDLIMTVHTEEKLPTIYMRSRRVKMFSPDPARKLSANLYDIYHCSAYSGKLLMMDRGTVRNM